MSKIVVTGHRPQVLPGGFKNKKLHVQIKNVASQYLEEQENLDLVITGMALGWDQWIAEICIDMKIPFIAAVPYLGQETKWPTQSQQHYKWLLSKAAKIVQVDRVAGYLSSTVHPDVYHPFKLIMRNRWMIDQMGPGDKLFSLFDPSSTKSGTANTIDWWRSQNIRGTSHISIDPSHISTNLNKLMIPSEDDSNFDDVPF